MKRYSLIIGCCFIILQSCVHEPVIPQPQPLEYLFLAHTRHNNQDLQRVEPAVEEIDFDRFQMLLLGGDLTANSSREDTTMQYLNELFDLASPQTLLAPGNHDVDDLNRLLSYTRRPSFYSYTQDGITFVVFDTQKDQCSILGPQLDMLQNIVDTLSQSDQLIIIHHKLLWMPGNPDLEPQIPAVSNAGFCPFAFCLFQNNFWQDVYPLLEQVQSKGKQVILAGGDVGFQTKYFEHTTPEGIVFLASGLDQGDPDNEALIFSKNRETKRLSWRRKLLE